MYHTVVTLCTAQWSRYVPHSDHCMYRTVVTVCTTQWSLYVQPSGHYMYRQFNIQQFYVLSTQCVYVFCVDLRTNSDLLRTAVLYVTAIYSKVFTARYDLNLALQFILMLPSTVYVVALAVSRRPATTVVRVRSRTNPSEICEEQNGPRTGSSPGTSRLPCQCHSTNAPCVLFLQEEQTSEVWEPSERNSCRILGGMARILSPVVFITFVLPI